MENMCCWELPGRDASLVDKVDVRVLVSITSMCGLYLHEAGLRDVVIPVRDASLLGVQVRDVRLGVVLDVNPVVSLLDADARVFRGVGGMFHMGPLQKRRDLEEDAPVEVL